MTLQASGPISLLNLQGEFGGSSPISLSEYYSNWTNVTSNATAPNVPTSGTIRLSNFYSASAGRTTFNTTTPNTATGTGITYTARTNDSMVNCGVNITFSTNAGDTYAGARATHGSAPGKSSGKWIASFWTGSATLNDGFVGICSAGMVVNSTVIDGNTWPGFGTNSAGLWFNSGNTNTQASLMYNYPTRTNNDYGRSFHGLYITICWDATSRLFWLIPEVAGYNWNNSSTANPATGVGGIQIASTWADGTTTTYLLVGATNTATGTFRVADIYPDVPQRTVSGFSTWG